VQAGPHLGAGGATSFMFDHGRPFGWQMNIQGSYERILDSVLPHEVTHTIFATHFGRPLPRWADEGACTTVEHVSEKTKQARFLIEFLTTGRGIAFNEMFAMREYPRDILPLYSQGYSLARYLIAQGGKRKFIDYVGDGMKWNNWTAATKEHYGFESLSDLQVTWLDWVGRGSPPVEPKSTLVALNDQARGQASISNAVVRTSTSQASVAPASATLASADGSFDSWYARQRTRPRTGSSGDGRMTAATLPKSEPEPLIRSSVTRPQGPNSPEPTVLQGSAEIAPSHGRVLEAAVPLQIIPQSTQPLPARY
jgi:hypothetical protein